MLKYVLLFGALCALLLVRRRWRLIYAGRQEYDLHTVWRFHLLRRRASKPPSVDGRHNGRAPTSKPPSDRSQDGKWMQFTHRVISAGFYRFGHPRLVDTDGNVRGSSMLRTTSAPATNSGSHGEPEDSIPRQTRGRIVLDNSSSQGVR